MLERLGKIYHLSVAPGMFLVQRRRDFFFHDPLFSTQNVVDNNSSFNCKLFLSFLLNSSENERSVSSNVDL